MGKRFGDKNDLTTIGWSMLLDGLVGIDVTPEQEIIDFRSSGINS